MKNISKNKSLFPAKLGILWLVWRSVSWDVVWLWFLGASPFHIVWKSVPFRVMSGVSIFFAVCILSGHIRNLWLYPWRPIVQ
jgi:hypothetical protein